MLLPEKKKRTPAILQTMRKWARAIIGGVVAICAVTGAVVKKLDDLHIIDILQGVQSLATSPTPAFLQLPALPLPDLSLPGVTKLTSLAQTTNPNPFQYTYIVPYNTSNHQARFLIQTRDDEFDLAANGTDVHHFAFDSYTAGSCGGGIAVAPTGAWAFCRPERDAPRILALPDLTATPLTSSLSKPLDILSYGVAFSPDGRFVVMPQDDTNGCALNVFSVDPTLAVMQQVASFRVKALSLGGQTCVGYQPNWLSQDVIDLKSFENQTIMVVNISAYVSQLQTAPPAPLVITVTDDHVTALAPHITLGRFSWMDHTATVVLWQEQDSSTTISTYNLTTNTELPLLTIPMSVPVCQTAIATDGSSLIFSLCSYDQPTQSIKYEDFYWYQLSPK